MQAAAMSVSFTRPALRAARPAVSARRTLTQRSMVVRALGVREMRQLSGSAGRGPIPVLLPLNDWADR